MSDESTPLDRLKAALGQERIAPTIRTIMVSEDDVRAAVDEIERLQLHFVEVSHLLAEASAARRAAQEAAVDAVKYVTHTRRDLLKELRALSPEELDAWLSRAARGEL